MKKNTFYKIIFLLFISFVSCEKKKPKEKITFIDSLTINYVVINTLPHDVTAFTEGLEISNNKMYESTGLNGSSWIAEVNSLTGVHNKKAVLDDRYFGEGITVLNNKIYQLTYKTKIGFIYNATTYKQTGTFTFDMAEGWGMTHNSDNLIISDGSDKLYFVDTTNLKVVKTITVTDGGSPVRKLNELEYINGSIYANVWESSKILKIDPVTGKVTGRLDLSAITSEIARMYPDADVLNGIAYDVNAKALLITGKLWPKSYLIKLQ